MLKYVVETRDAPKKPWRPLRDGGTYVDRDRAISRAALFNAARVRSTGHEDGMDRTEYICTENGMPTQ